MSTVTDIDHGYRRILRDLAKTDKAEVFVGIRQAKGSEEHDPGSGITIAEIGTIHEFGAPAANIPERSFLRATVDQSEGLLQKRLAHGMGQVLDGTQTVTGALSLVGETAVGAVQVRIAKGIAPALAPATIAAKGSSKPLIDTGRLRGSIEYEVRVESKETASGSTAKGDA